VVDHHAEAGHPRGYAPGHLVQPGPVPLPYYPRDRHAASLITASALKRPASSGGRPSGRRYPARASARITTRTGRPATRDRAGLRTRAYQPSRHVRAQPPGSVTKSDCRSHYDRARSADQYSDGRVSLDGRCRPDQVILARRRSWPLTMRTASSLSQSMKMSELLELSTWPSGRYFLRCTRELLRVIGWQAGAPGSSGGTR